MCPTSNRGRASFSPRRKPWLCSGCNYFCKGVSVYDVRPIQPSVRQRKLRVGPQSFFANDCIQHSSTSRINPPYRHISLTMQSPSWKNPSAMDQSANHSVPESPVSMSYTLEGGTSRRTKTRQWHVQRGRMSFRMDNGDENSICCDIATKRVESMDRQRTCSTLFWRSWPFDNGGSSLSSLLLQLHQLRLSWTFVFSFELIHGKFVGSFLPSCNTSFLLSAYRLDSFRK